MKNFKISIILVCLLVLIPNKAFAINSNTVQLPNNSTVYESRDNLNNTWDILIDTLNDIYAKFKNIIEKYTIEYREIGPKIDIPNNKAWKIKFNRKLSSIGLNKDCIKVLDKKGNEVNVQLKIDAADNSILQVLPPKDLYKSGETYALIITKNIINDTTEMIKSLKLKKEVVMYFTIAEDNGGNGGDSENSTDEIFKQEDIDQYFSTERAEVKNGQIYYTYDGVVDYLPETKTNPDINKQIYALLKTLLEDNEKGNYVMATYLDDREDCDMSSIWITLTECKKYPIEKFTFKFEETGLNEFNNNSKVWLQLEPLSDNEYMNKWEEIGLDQAYYYQPYYLEKLKDSIKAVFPNEKYEEIYDYIMEQYELYTHDKPFKNNKKIDNINIVAHYTNSGMFYIFFQY